jgi:hypothetical protein
LGCVHAVSVEGLACDHVDLEHVIPVTVRVNTGVNTSVNEPTPNSLAASLAVCQV